nr:reverse transcriptase domain-containing protein [Tanacetum cinerariifolium]
MSTRSSERNLFPPLANPELTIRRRSHADPTLLNEFEMATDRNGDPLVPDLRTIEELCQPSLNGRGGPIALIAIQGTNFRLKNDMIQQVQNPCQFPRISGDDANKHLDKFLLVTQSIKVNGVTDDALRLLTSKSKQLFLAVKLMVVLILTMIVQPPLAKPKTYMLRELIKVMNTASSSGSGTLPSNTITNPKEDLNGITTRNGTAYQGPTIPTTSSSLPQVVECETKVIKDMVPPTNNESTKDVQPLVVQIKTLIPNSEPIFALVAEPVLAPVAKNDKSSIDEPPEVELKDLPPHLEYAFLEGNDKLPVIIVKDLSVEEKSALIKVLKSYKRAITWKLSDVKGINPEFCTHKILMEDDFEPAIQPQRRVNPKIYEVIKKEVLKRLDSELIYPISDSPWEKSHFMVKEDIILSHKISKNGIEVDKAKVDVIAKLPHPTTVKGFRSFLGHAGFYRRFIQEFSNIARPMTRLLEKDTPFGTPRAIISDRGTHFFNDQFAKVMLKYGITHRLATAYHQQTSGYVEVSNHGLKRILERTVGENRASWSDKLDDALWAFRTAFKTPIGCTPYKLVYGKVCHLPIELERKAYWSLKHANFELQTEGNHRKVQLNELNKLRDQANENSLIHKEKTKRIHDSKIKDRVFNVSDRVLLFNSRLKIFSGKLKTRWSRQFTITQVFPYGTVELSQTDGPNFKVNGHRLKHYFREDIPKMVVPDLQTFPKDQ